MKTNPQVAIHAPDGSVAAAIEPANAPDRKSDLSGTVIYSTPVDQLDGPLSLREAVARYLMLRVAEGLPENGDTFGHLTKYLTKRLCSSLGDMALKAIKADHIRHWSAGLKNDRTGAALDVMTKRHHLVATRTFFRRCWREGWIERDPTMPIVLPAMEERDVHVISVEQAFTFFKANRDHRAIGRTALEAFGGLRYTSAGRISKSEIRFDRRGIEMPSRKHKSRRKKYRQNQPANCWAWLAHAPEECWSLTFRQYREEKKEMAVMAKLRPMILKTEEDKRIARDLKNIWRHSFASYHLVMTKEYAGTAYLMQHARSTTTEIYEGRADELDAWRYFSITPATVLLSWTQFCESIPSVPVQQYPDAK